MVLGDTRKVEGAEVLEVLKRGGEKKKKKR